VDREIMARRKPGTVTIDLDGRTVIPGLNDSHTHAAAAYRVWSRSAT